MRKTVRRFAVVSGVAAGAALVLSGAASAAEDDEPTGTDAGVLGGELPLVGGGELPLVGGGSLPLVGGESGSLPLVGGESGSLPLLGAADTASLLAPVLGLGL